MKTRILYFTVLVALILSVFPACNELESEENGQEPVDMYLVSHEVHKTYLPALIKAVLGQVSSNYPEFSPLIDQVEHEITVYKISYNTRFNGEQHTASGLVCVPNNGEGFPILSYQNGTNTEHSKAPSVNPDNELFLLLQFMASTGFIVTIPDYLGFGESDNIFHPYLHAESTVQTIIDMQFAVKEMIENHLEITTNNDMYIAGYSQGGWATLQLQKELEENHAERFNLKASACGAGPYNLNYITELILGQEDYPMPYFLGYIFNSYYNLNLITTPIEDVFQDPYADKILSLYDGTMAGEAINNELIGMIPKLFQQEFIDGFATDPKYSSIVSALAANSIEAWKTEVPTMLLHGTDDTFVPPMGTSRIFQEFLGNGVGSQNIIMVPLTEENHQSGIIPSGIASMLWFLELKNQTGV